MICPYCDQELKYHDWYGINMGFNRSGNKKGDIFKCHNEDCESNSFNYLFYTKGKSDDLHEGHPC